MKSDELIDAAKLGRTVGLKGFLKLHDFSDFPEQFKKGERFFVDENESLEIAEFDKQKNIVRFVGVSDKDTASKLTNKILKTTKEATKNSCKLKKDEFFWFDIIGCKVIEDAEILGTVDKIERIGSSDYLHVITDEKFVKKGSQKSFLIPYIDRFIIHADIDAKEITTRYAAYFLE
ncbi:MAG: ribosome maturation factor RimM [Campylobacteraceae bacterium]|jgi:16S rRNA processing protein RimM|nr:ribosome maturation factor RimM [Campylobacteraceae bacterium]